MKKVVVTGGAGFVGSLIINELVFQNYEVVCVDNLRYGYNPVLAHLSNFSNFEFILMDLCQNFNCKQWKQLEGHIGNADYVIHLACLVGYPICEKEPDCSKAATMYAVKGVSALDALRESVDAAEGIVADELWPLAKYQELLLML